MILSHKTRIGVALLTLLMLAAAVLLFVRATDRIEVRASFTETKGLYVGDDVTYLGIPIGRITDIETKTDRVDVTMSIDRGVQLPADARAAIIAPSLVAVRAVAIGPVYRDGPVLRDGGRIPLSRTVVPTEWDEVKDELVRLSDALSPETVDGEVVRDGALDELITSSARFLEGNGERLGTTIQDMSEAMTTLADNRGSIFSTVRNLQVFTDALESSDIAVRGFNQNLAAVAKLLDEDRDEVQAALASLKRTFADLDDFLLDNQEQLSRTLTTAQKITSAFAEHPQGLADILHLAPTALSNFYNILDPRVPALTGSLGVSTLADPASFVCSALFSMGGTYQDCVQAIKPLAQYFKMNAPPVGLLLAEDGGTDDGTETYHPEYTDGTVPGAPTPTGSSSAAQEADILGQVGSLLKGGSR